MSLYADKEEVKKTILRYTQLHECSQCGKYFTEMENIGCWKCKYHPGEYDHDLERYTCCGETYKRPKFHYKGYGHLMTWGVKDRWNHMKPVSDGCTRCDCKTNEPNEVEYKDVQLNDIAQLIPYMEINIRDRPGLRIDPLRLERVEVIPDSLRKL